MGTDHRRVLRLLGSQRVDVDHSRGLVDASGFGRQAHTGRGAHRGRRRQRAAAEPAGRNLFRGRYPFEYLNDPAKTAASRNKHGWVTVGDVGYLDDDGYLFLTGRRHHMIISGGVNIYPQEAENLLVAHPKVLDAAVFGVPDDEMGQRVMAAVQTVDSADANDQFAGELLAWLRDRLSHFKCPRSIAFEPQLPRTDTGKLYKSGLVEKYSV